jgi:hypothetical protein
MTVCDTNYRLYVYRLTDKIIHGTGDLPFGLQQCFTTVWEIRMLPVDIGVPCVNVRTKVFLCTTRYASHSVVWSAVRSVGRQIAQTGRHMSSLYFNHSANQSVAHKIFQSVGSFPGNLEDSYSDIISSLNILNF